MSTTTNKATRPAKEYNHMTGKMEDTSLPQWQEYYKEKEAHDAHFAAIEPVKPNPLDYSSIDAFNKALEQYKIDYAAWDMARSCDAPNKPGYYRAAND